MSVGREISKSYSAVHKWIVKERGSAQQYKCSECLGTHRQMEWANVSGEYIRDLRDWRVMCNPCHQVYDQSGFYSLKKDKLEKTCMFCSGVFYVFPYRKETAKFCSLNCKMKHQHADT